MHWNTKDNESGIFCLKRAFWEKVSINLPSSISLVCPHYQFPHYPIRIYNFISFLLKKQLILLPYCLPCQLELSTFILSTHLMCFVSRNEVEYIHTQQGQTITSNSQLIKESLWLDTCQEVRIGFVAMYPTMCFREMSKALFLPSLHP